MFKARKARKAHQPPLPNGSTDGSSKGSDSSEMSEDSEGYSSVEADSSQTIEDGSWESEAMGIDPVSPGSCMFHKTLFENLVEQLVIQSEHLEAHLADWIENGDVDTSTTVGNVGLDRPYGQSHKDDARELDYELIRRTVIGNVFSPPTQEHGMSSEKEMTSTAEAPQLGTSADFKPDWSKCKDYTAHPSTKNKKKRSNLDLAQREIQSLKHLLHKTEMRRKIAEVELAYARKKPFRTKKRAGGPVGGTSSKSSSPGLQGAKRAFRRLIGRSTYIDIWDQGGDSGLPKTLSSGYEI